MLYSSSLEVPLIGRSHRARRSLLALSALLSFAAPGLVHAASFFQEVPNAYGAQACSGGQTGCWTNYARMTDLNGDDHLDVIFPNADGFFSKGSAQPTVVYLNNGDGTLTNASATVVGGYSGYVRQVAVADVDGDGNMDLYVPAAWGAADKLFMGAGLGAFNDDAANRLPPGLASYAGAARFGDVDDDGDLDLLVSDGWAQGAAYVAHLYLNDGTGHFSDATGQLPSSASGSQPIDFDLADVDGDFDLDLYIDMHSGKGSLWINDGTGIFTDASANIPGQSGLKYGPAVCDVDGDGDLDIWIDNSGPNYTEQLIINDGSGKFQDETSQRVTGNPGSDDNGVACIDVDGDGDLDAAVMSLSGNERILFNDGTGHFTHNSQDPGFPAVNDGTLWFDFGDIDGDGRLDCITAQGESSSLDRLYVGVAPAPVDTLPPHFRAVEGMQATYTTEDVPVFHFAVSDNAVTDEGPRLSKAYVKLSVSGAPTEVRAKFMGGDLFRVALPSLPGGSTVDVTPCAVDRRGNEQCAPIMTYTVTGSTSTTTSTTTTSASSGVGGGSSTASTGSTGVGGDSSSEVGAGGSDEPFTVDDSGCGCVLPGQASGKTSGLWIALGLFGLGLKRRGRRQPRG